MKEGPEGEPLRDVAGARKRENHDSFDPILAGSTSIFGATSRTLSIRCKRAHTGLYPYSQRTADRPCE